MPVFRSAPTPLTFALVWLLFGAPPINQYIYYLYERDRT